jgi:hypothetical protein
VKHYVEQQEVLWNNGESTFANVTCSAGLSMGGQSVLQCRSDGTWDFNTPSCGKIILYNIQDKTNLIIMCIMR